MHQQNQTAAYFVLQAENTIQPHIDRFTFQNEIHYKGNKYLYKDHLWVISLDNGAENVLNFQSRFCADLK